MMGSGGNGRSGQDDCMVEVARYVLDFTQKESAKVYSLPDWDKTDAGYHGGHYKGSRENGRPVIRSNSSPKILRKDLLCGLGRSHPILSDHPAIFFARIRSPSPGGPMPGIDCVKI